MRAIKFRAWNKKTKTMVDLHKITPLVLNAEIDGLFIPFRNDIILMQSTGLHLKNGTEIYEKDVCENEYGWRGVIAWDSTEPIGFRSAWTGWWWHSIDLKRDGKFPFHVDKKTKILGNIYQHPDLLRKE